MLERWDSAVGTQERKWQVDGGVQLVWFGVLVLGFLLFLVVFSGL